MSENTQVDQSVESPKAQASEEQQENVSNWTAQQLAERLKVVNAEARENRKRAQDEKRKREELEKKIMAESGQFKELAEVWQRKATEAETQSLKIKEAFAVKAISDSVAMEAQRLGCVDPEALIGLIKLNELPLDENFNVDKTHVKAVIEDMRKQKPYFFKQAAPKVLDAPPAKSEEPKNDLSKLSLHEKAQLLSMLKKQGK